MSRVCGIFHSTEAKTNPFDQTKTFKASWSEVLMAGVSGQRRRCCVSLTALPMFLTVGYFYDHCSLSASTLA